ncbi:MAG: GAF domain-containing protein [Acidobacteriota bacterium]
MDGEQDPTLSLVRSLLAAEHPGELYRRLASAALDALEADWTAVWIFDRAAKRFTPEVFEPPEPFSPSADGAGRRGDLLREVVGRSGPVVRRARELRETMLQHLDARQRSRAREIFCAPFAIDDNRIGILEAVREIPSPPEKLEEQRGFLAACVPVASAAAAAAARALAERERQMAVVTRLTQLYDVSQVFHASLERDSVLASIADRVSLIMEAPLCRLWFPGGDAESLDCAFQSGGGEAEVAPLGRDGGPAWIACHGGAPVLVPLVADSEWADALRDAYGPERAGSVLCAPLKVNDDSLGAVEVVRPPGERPFTDDDRDFLEELAREAARALRNANLFAAEKKAKELDALLDISREITSTLDLDRVLITIVNRADAIAPSDRCAILMAEGQRAAVQAVSGQLDVDRKDPRIRELEEILLWAHMGGRGLYISELDGEIEAEREETKEKFRRYFQRSGMKTFVALPLKDEEGCLGMLSLESRQPYFLSEDKLEIFNILANQATVAIRNASLYRRIPLAGIMGSLADWKTRLRTVPRWKWLRNAGMAAILTAVLVLAPWNMKVSGRALVLPAKNSTVTAEIGGVVEAVYRREGDRVSRGDLLATLVDRDYRARLEEARTRHAIARREVAESEAALDATAASKARIRLARWQDELDLLRYKLDRARILSPVDGVVLTPRLEQKVGAHLDRGEEFCHIADMNEVQVEILVPETEIGEIETGQKVRFKIDSFPTRTFTAAVDIIGQRLIEDSGTRSLIVRAHLTSGEFPLKAGMSGRAKIEVGRRSVGYVLLRKPARFLWRHLWTWLP